MIGELSKTFIEEFFGDGNEFSQDQLTVFVHFGDGQWILPRKYADGRIAWYAISATERQHRMLCSQLLAFIGPSYSDFDGAPPVWDDADPVEVAVRREFGDRVSRLGVPEGYDGNELESALKTWERVLSMRPTRGLRDVRAPGTILGDFDEAIRVGDANCAVLHRDELIRAGHLNAPSKLFLAVQIAGCERRWGAILAAPLNEALRVRRPRRVSELFCQAVVESRLREHQRANDAQAALVAFQALDQDVHEAILDCTEVQGEAAETCVALLSVAMPRYRNLGIALVGRQRTAASREWIASIVGIGGEYAVDERQASADPGGDAPSATPRESLPASTPETAGESDATTLVQRLLRVAPKGGVPDPVAINEVLDACRRAPAEVQTLVADSDVYRRLAKWLPPTDDETSIVPNSWREWVGGLVAAKAEWPRGQDLVRALGSSWAVDTYLTSRGEASDLADALEQVEGDNVGVLLGSLPHLIEAFAGEHASSTLRPVFRVLVEQLVCADERGNHWYRQLGDLLAAHLAAGIDASTYSDWMTSIAATAAGASALEFDGLLFLCEVLMNGTCPDSEAREALIGAALNAALMAGPRIRPEERGQMVALCEELGLDVPERLRERLKQDDHQRQHLYEALSGKTIAIYSLDINAMRRAKEQILRRAPACTVLEFDDHAGGSSSLKHAARNSDIFVIVTTKAKHAATNFIEDHLRRDGILLRPPGGGSASIVRSVFECAEGLASGLA